MRKLLDKYYGILRKVKANYVLLNLTQYSKLKHNQKIYKQYGLKKSVVAPISSYDFVGFPEELPWLDRPDATDQLQWHPEFVTFNESIQEQLKQWPENGYMILESFFTENEVDGINTEIENLIKSNKVDFNFTGRKIMFAHKHSELLRGVAKNARLSSLLSFVLGRKVKPFQTINFIRGSEQRAHSDFIHMTTHPKGNLIAAWIALEDITSDNGPLIYYPGSHKLPYLLNTEFDHGGSTLMIGDDAYLRYEEEVQKRIAENHLQPREFHAKKGDVLIWHGNLLHAGKAIINEQLTRKSMVVHFYAEGVICYHDLTQRPAILEQI
jgi:ectoine hydroxylase